MLAPDVLPVDYTQKGSNSTWKWSKAESLSTPVCCTVSTTQPLICTAAAKHRRSARVRALLLRRRPSVCPSILFPLSDFSRQWSPGVDQVRTKIIESIFKDEEGSLTFWKYGPNHRSPARLCRHCWRCYRRWRLEHRQPACCRCQEGEAVKYSSSFPPSFYLGCDTITGKTELKFWQTQDYRSALEYNFFWDVEHRSEMSECVAVRISLTETRERHLQSNLWEIVGKSWDPGGIRGFRQNFHQAQYNSQTRPSVWRKQLISMW